MSNSYKERIENILERINQAILSKPRARDNTRSTKDQSPLTTYLAPEHSSIRYAPAMIGAPTIGRQVVQSDRIRAALDLLVLLEEDAYSRYLMEFFREGLNRFGEEWGYADIMTVLMALGDVLRPRRYLEIGARRGRSVCALAGRVPECDLFIFDMWIGNYAGIDNPGPDLVRAELGKVGHKGAVTFVEGDSHQTLPRFFAQNPRISFDVITVDGDHSIRGATRDILDVLPHLAVGGAIVFDDIAHPDLPWLGGVWRRLVVDNPRFSTWSYDEVGFGVGFGIRKW